MREEKFLRVHVDIIILFVYNKHLNIYSGVI